jgi:hypothetical protein
LEQDEVLLRVDDLPVDMVSGMCCCHQSMMLRVPFG